MGAGRARERVETTRAVPARTVAASGAWDTEETMLDARASGRRTPEIRARGTESKIFKSLFLAAKSVIVIVLPA